MAHARTPTVRLTAEEIAAVRAFVELHGIDAALRASDLRLATLRKVLAGAEPVARLTGMLVRERLVRDSRRI